MITLFLLMLQMQVQVTVNLPTLRFETAPTMVEVQPGVLVVEDQEDEVFYADRWYWVRWRDGRWYRSRDHRGGWVAAQPAMVPVVLAGLPPGRYKHHHGRPEKYRVVNPDGSVTEVKVKEKHGMVEVTEKHKKGKWKKGRWK